jgi:hypothetical protein
MSLSELKSSSGAGINALVRNTTDGGHGSPVGLLGVDGEVFPESEHIRIALS